jgi:FixJ family two-component response regulator
LAEIPLVVIVGDNDSAGWAVARVIGSAGFRVLVFPSAEEFIESGQIDCAACLVVDLYLPGMGGLRLQSHLARAGRHIPIIFMVAGVDERARTRGIELGAVDVLDRRSGDQALLNKIRAILTPGGAG